MTRNKSGSKSPEPKRSKIFFLRGFQLRYTLLVAGSLVVLLIFAGFHGFFVTATSLTEETFQSMKPALFESTLRLFVVGVLYVVVVTIAAVFLSHRSVGPTGRLEEEIKELAEGDKPTHSLRVREGDELESLVKAINNLIHRLKRSK